MDPTWLFLSSLFSLIGTAVLVYGRKQRMIAPTLVGVALMGYPYFVSTSLGVVAVGILLLGALVIGVRMENGA